jgi:hypothetical protein
MKMTQQPGAGATHSGCSVTSPILAELSGHAEAGTALRLVHCRVRNEFCSLVSGMRESKVLEERPNWGAKRARVQEVFEDGSSGVEEKFRKDE